MKAYFKFLQYQYRLGKIDETHLEQAVNKGYITEEERGQIINGSN
jgi:hypothetical protein